MNQPATTPKMEPQCCPFCGNFQIIRNLVEWEARSTEPQDRDNTATLNEHQCDCGRSFWT